MKDFSLAPKNNKTSAENEILQSSFLAVFRVVSGRKKATAVVVYHQGVVWDGQPGHPALGLPSQADGQFPAKFRGCPDLGEVRPGFPDLC